MNETATLTPYTRRRLQYAARLLKKIIYDMSWSEVHVARLKEDIQEVINLLEGLL